LPAVGDHLGLRGNPRERAQDRVELGVDGPDGRLERTEVLGFHPLQRGGQRVEVGGGGLEIHTDLDQRRGQHHDHDHRKNDTEDDQRALAHDSPNPSVRAFI
jgi:hypothetical protein